MPDSSLMSVNEILCFFSVFVMAFSAVRSICFIGSPPAPVPRFGCGCFSVFSCGVICFFMLFLHWVRIWSQLVCLVIGGRYCFVLLLFDKGFCGLFCLCVRATA